MPRKKKEVIEHRTLGLGTVKHRKTTDYGDALVIDFASRQRTILLEGDWVNPKDARAAWDTAKDEARPKNPPEKPRLRSEEDDEAETVEEWTED
jgi:hypothetical protein